MSVMPPRVTGNDLSSASKCRLKDPTLQFHTNGHFTSSMRAGKFVVSSLTFLLLFLHAEAKKKRGWNSQRRLRRLCSRPIEANQTQNNSALEMHAFFDLNPNQKNHKAFACLKITTCSTKPVCFVTSYPNLNTSAVNETTKWWELLSDIQKDRKIEVINDGSQNGWNGDKHNYIQNQPAIYRMCLGATIYRFVHTSEDKKSDDTNHVKRAINSSDLQSPPTNTTSGGIDPTLCPVFAKENSKNIIPIRYLFCHGPNCPCMRICVGQGRNRTNFHDCSTFRIICTFDCTESDKTTLLSTTSRPQVSAKSTSSQRKNRPSKKRKLRGRKKKKDNQATTSITPMTTTRKPGVTVKTTKSQRKHRRGRKKKKGSAQVTTTIAPLTTSKPKRNAKNTSKTRKLRRKKKKGNKKKGNKKKKKGQKNVKKQNKKTG